MQRYLILLCACCALLTLPRAAHAQNVLRPDTMLVADTTPSEQQLPRAAFIRALLVPGWGHAYLGEYRRAGVYATLQTTSWFMLIKTLDKLGAISDRDRALTALARDSVRAAMAADTMLARQLSDPVRFEAALLTYPGLEHARDLVNSRQRQRQDWLVYTIFFTFASAVDAYVTAHLKDFPADITATPTRDGGMSFSVRVPSGVRR